MQTFQFQIIIIINRSINLVLQILITSSALFFDKKLGLQNTQIVKVAYDVNLLEHTNTELRLLSNTMHVAR